MDNEYEGLGKILEYKSSCREDETLQMRFDYSPTLEHSEKFADLTGDSNSIHRELFEGETISPAFLQNVAAILASREAIAKYGINCADFPVSFNRESLDNFVVTGIAYELIVNLKDKPLEISVEIIESGPKRKRVFRMDRNFEGAEPPKDYSKLIHSGSFDVRGLSLSQFGKIIGTISPESNLYCMASSSSTIFGASEAKKLPKMEEGVVPIYSEQEFYLDTSRSVSGGVDALLSIDEVPHGSFKIKDKLKTMIGSWHRGNLVNRIASEIVFQSEKLPVLAVKKALRARNRCI